MKGVRVPKPVKELIISRVKNGEKIDDLAKEFNLFPNTIRKWLNSSVTDSGRDLDSKRSDILLISKLQREKQELLEIIGELTVLTKQSKKKLK